MNKQEDEHIRKALSAAMRRIGELEAARDAALLLVADLRKATRDHAFILTLDPRRREVGERLLDRADGLLGLTRAGEPAEVKS